MAYAMPGSGARVGLGGPVHVVGDRVEDGGDVAAAESLVHAHDGLDVGVSTHLNSLPGWPLLARIRHRDRRRISGRAGRSSGGVLGEDETGQLGAGGDAGLGEDLVEVV